MDNTQPAQPQTTAHNPANLWPGAFGIFKLSRKAIMLNIGPVLTIIGINMLANTPSTITNPGQGGSIGLLYFAFTVAGALLSLFLTVAQIDIELSGARGEKLTVGQSFRHVSGMWLKMAGLMILLSILTAVSTIALIIPFFFVFPRLVLAPYFLIDKKMGVTEAINASWNQTKGHSSKVWGIIGASIAMALIMVTIIGIPLAIYLLVMYSAAFAVLYMHITGQPIEPTNAVYSNTNSAAPQPAIVTNSSTPVAPVQQQQNTPQVQQTTQETAPVQPSATTEQPPQPTPPAPPQQPATTTEQQAQPPQPQQPNQTDTPPPPQNISPQQ